MTECQSTNHIKCYDYGAGDPVILWRCANCKKWLCYADGCADENYELCDSCVAENKSRKTLDIHPQS